MAENSSTNLVNIYLLPSSENLVKTGAVLYLTGVACTFFYFSQFNILSIDYLKPNAIILGIYQWLYFVVIPRSIILLLHSLTKPRMPVIIIAVVFFILAVVCNTLLLLFLNAINWKLFFLSVFITSLIFCYYMDFKKGKLNIIPSHFKSYAFSIVFCISFSYFVFPKIPYELGGAKPMEVNVTCSDTTLLKSRFSKTTYLLYSTDNDYYFIEKKQDANTKAIYAYVVKKVSKSQIKKIEFTKSLWQPF